MAKTSGPTGPVDYPPPPELAPLIGELVMAFSYSETAVQLLISRISGLSFLDGRALTGRLDAKPKLRLLEQLCERHMKSTVQASRVAAAVKALEAAVDYGIWLHTGIGERRKRANCIASPSSTTPGRTRPSPADMASSPAISSSLRGPLRIVAWRLWSFGR
jgi:hypothetical protein